MQHNPLEGRNKGEQLYNRGAYEREQLEERRARELDEARRAEVAELRDRPQISKQAAARQSHADFAAYNSKWAAERERKLKLERERLVEEEGESLKPSTINAHSEALASITRVPIVDDWDQHFREFVARRENKPLEFDFTPHIDDRAAALQRDEPVYERLFREAQLRSLDQMRKQEEQVRELEAMSAHATLNQSSLARALSPRSDELGDESAGIAHLYLDAAAMEARRLARQAELDEQLRAQVTGRPQLNPRSVALVSRARRARAGDTSFGGEPSTPRSATSPRGNAASPISAQSSLTPAEAKRVNEAKMHNFLARNAAKANEYQARGAYARKVAKAAAMKECSFTPEIIQSPVRPTTAQTSSAESIWERAERKRVEREARVKAELEKRKELEMRECTFSPASARRVRRPQSAASPSSSSRTPTMNTPRSGAGAPSAGTPYASHRTPGSTRAVASLPQHRSPPASASPPAAEPSSSSSPTSIQATPPPPPPAAHADSAEERERRIIAEIALLDEVRASLPTVGRRSIAGELASELESLDI